MKLQILNAFRAFPAYNFIWKFDEDDKDLPLLSNYTNVFPIKWLPQVPLLNDDRVKLFITHFGMNSYLEASNAGKPMIGTIK
jgi:UDP:flavonoid glycosyltransferase YjiC (YdhE family)